MTTIDRINRLRAHCGLPLVHHHELVHTNPERGAHDIIDEIDVVMQFDSRTIPNGQCSCLFHTGAACSAKVRQVGARLALLERALARGMVDSMADVNPLNLERFFHWLGREAMLAIPVTT